MTSAVRSWLAAAPMLLVLAASAAEPPAGRPPGPPPEAVAACQGKSVGEAVTFTGRRGETFTGTCQKDGEVLAARPSGMPPRDGGGGTPRK